MAKVKESFSAGEAARITGVPYRTLDHWARTKFIAPSIAQADGIGSDRKYDFKDLVALRVAIGLRQSGVSTQALQRVTDHLRTWKDARNSELLANFKLVVTGSDVQVVFGYDEMVSVLKKPGQSAFAFTVDIGRTVQEIKQSILALRSAA
jgi:DNA-binding transcriptional MerR regulator